MSRGVTAWRETFMKDKQRYTQWLDLLILSLTNCQHELNPQLYATWKDNQRLGVQAMHADHRYWESKPASKPCMLIRNGTLPGRTMSKPASKPYMLIRNGTLPGRTMSKPASKPYMLIRNGTLPRRKISIAFHADP